MNKRIALVTGAGGGLGRYIAKHLSIEGDLVVCADIDFAQAEATAKEIVDEGGSASVGVVDVSKEESIQDLAEQIHSQAGRVSALINVASVLDRRGLVDLTMLDFSAVMAVNVVGTFGMIKAFDSDLRATTAGRIVNVASQSGTIGYEYPAYAASKAAVIHLTRCLLLEYWGTDVRVNAVSPGPMNTPMMDSSRAASFRQGSPTGELTSLESVAEIVGYLASPTQTAINGQNIVADGGTTSAFRWPSTTNEQPPASVQ